MAAIHVILEPPKIKSATVSPSICHEVIGLDAMILVYWMLSFKPTFSVSSFTFIKRLLSSSSLSAIRVLSSTYLRLLIFLPAILIPTCASSILHFSWLYSAYKLNKHGDNIQPWPTLRGAGEAFHSWQRSWGRRLGLRKGGIKSQESPRIFSSIFPP